MLAFLIIPIVFAAIVYVAIEIAVKGGTRAQRMITAGAAALWIALIVFTLASIEGTTPTERAAWSGCGALIWLIIAALMNRRWKLLAALCALLLLVGALWGFCHAGGF